MARPRPSVITLTEAAAGRVHEIIAESDTPIAGLRLGVKNAGCAGMAYTMDYAAEPQANDEIVESRGVKIFIDPRAILFLLGTTMDYRVEKLSAQFVFDNPNQTDACGCGESVSLQPAALDAD